MDAITTIAKNSLVLQVARTSSMAMGLFYTIYMARYLGTEGYGMISFALALAGIFSIFADFGLTTLTTREVSKDTSRSGEYFSQIALIKLPLVITASLIIIILISVFGYPEKTVRVVSLITISFVFSSFIGLFNSIFQAHQEMEFISIGTVLYSLVLLTGTLIAINYRMDITAFALLYCIANMIVLAYCTAIYLRKRFKFNVHFSPEFCKRAIIEAWPMGAMALCIVIYFRISTVILSIVKGEAAVGIYSAAYTLSEMTTLVPGIFVASIFPIISKYYGKRTSFNFVYERSVKYLCYMALPMALIVMIWSGPIISLVYGDAFSGSTTALQILIWAAAIMYVTMVIGTVFVSANLQMANMNITIATAILNIALNLLLIPTYGYVGASFITIVTEAFGLVLGVYVLDKNGYRLNTGKIFLLPLSGILLAGIAYMVMAYLHLNIVLITIICMTLYLSVILAKGVDKVDIRLIDQLLAPVIVYKNRKWPGGSHG
jgi:O-antigen/teichoic acid export membrane protein